MMPEGDKEEHGKRSLRGTTKEAASGAGTGARRGVERRVGDMAGTGAEAVSSSSVLFVLMISSSSRLLKRSLLEGKFSVSALATGGLEILKVLKRLEDRTSS